MDIAQLGIKVTISGSKEALKELKELREVASKIPEKLDIGVNVSKTSENIKRTTERLEKLSKTASSTTNYIEKIEEALASLNRTDLTKLTSEQLRAFKTELSRVNKTVFDLREQLDKVDYTRFANSIQRLADKHRNVSQSSKILEKDLENLRREEDRRARELEKVARSYEYADAECKNYIKSSRQAVVIAGVVGESYDQLLRRMQRLNREAKALKHSSSAPKIVSELDRIKAEYKYIKEAMRTLREYQFLNQHAKERMMILDYTLSHSIKDLTERFSGLRLALIRVQEWWDRFGKVAFGFTVMYRAFNLFEAGMYQAFEIIKNGIQLTGELVSTQAKLSMWLNIVSKGSISFKDAFIANTEAIRGLTKASLQSTATLGELSTALDEVGQAGVFFFNEDNMRRFASLVSFTKMVAQTTGSTEKQIRQELQALMQGEVKTTNILIRTALRLGIISKDTVKSLRDMSADTKQVVEDLMNAIDKGWSKVSKIIMQADVGLGLEKWKGALEYLISNIVRETSKRQGKFNIFGATVYEHIQNVLKKAEYLDIRDYEGGIIALNKALGVSLSFVESFIEKSLMLVGVIYKVNKAVEETTHGLSLLRVVGLGIAALVTKSAGWKVAISLGVISSYLNKIAETSVHLKSIADTVNDGIIIWALFGKNPKIAGILMVLDLAYRFIRDYTKSHPKNLSDIENQINNLMSKKKELEESLSKLSPNSQLYSFRKSDIEDELEVLTFQIHKLEQEKAKLLENKKQGLSIDKKALEIQKRLSEIQEEARKRIISEQLKSQMESLQKVMESIDDPLKTLRDTFLVATKIEGFDSVTKMLAVLQQVYPDSKDFLKELRMLFKTEGIPKTAVGLKNIYDAAKQIHEARQEVDKFKKSLVENDAFVKFTKDFELIRLVANKFKEDVGDEKIINFFIKLTKELGLNVDSQDILKKLLSDNIGYLTQFGVSAKDVADKLRKLNKEASHLNKINQLFLELSGKKDLEDFKGNFVLIMDTLAKYGDELDKSRVAEKIADISSNLIKPENRETFVENIANHITDLQKAGNDIDRIVGLLKSYAAVTEQIKKEDWIASMKAGLEDYLKSASDFASQFKSMMTGAFNSIEDALVRFVTTGKLSFKSLIQSISADLTRMMVRRYVTIPLASGMMAGMSGTAMASSGASSTSVMSAGYYAGKLIPSVGGFLSTPLPGTVVSYGSDAASLAAAQAGLPGATGLSIGGALGYAGLGALGYSLLASPLGLPSNQYSSLTAGLGAGLGAWGASAALSGTALGATLGSAVPVVGTIIGALVGGLASSLFTNNSPDHSWFNLFTGQKPSVPVDYSVASPLGTLYMPSKGYDLNDIGFDTEQRKQWEQEFINRIAELDKAMAQALGDTYIDAAREALQGKQFLGVWQTDKQEELDKLVKDFLYERYSKVFSVVDDRILRFFSKDEDIQTSLANIGGALQNFKKLSDNLKTLIVDLPDEIISQFEQAGYTDSQIFASLTQSFSTIPDLVEKVSQRMEISGDNLVSAYEYIVRQWEVINSLAGQLKGDLGSSLSSALIDAIYNAATAQEAGNKFAQAFQQQLYSSIIGVAAQAITNSMLQAITPVLTSFSESTVVAGNNLIAGSAVAGENVATGGVVGGSAVEIGGEKAAQALSQVVERVKEYINIMGHVLSDEGVQQELHRISSMFYSVGQVAYQTFHPVVYQIQTQYTPAVQTSGQVAEQASEEIEDFSEKIKALGVNIYKMWNALDVVEYFAEKWGYSVQEVRRAISDTLMGQSESKVKETVSSWVSGLEEMGYSTEDAISLVDNLTQAVKQWNDELKSITWSLYQSFTGQDIADVFAAQFGTSRTSLMSAIYRELDRASSEGLSSLSSLYESWINYVHSLGYTLDDSKQIVSELVNVTQQWNDELKNTSDSMINMLDGFSNSISLFLSKASGVKESDFWKNKATSYLLQYGNSIWSDADKIKELGDIYNKFYQAITNELESSYNDLENLLNSVSGVKDKILEDVELFGKTDEEKIGIYTDKINELMNTLSSSPENASQLNDLIQKRWSLELQSVSKLNDEIKGLDSIIDDIGKSVTSLITSSGSAYPIYSQLRQAESHYRELLGKAQAGDKQAISEYMSYINEYLGVERRYSATSDEYLKIQYKVQKDLLGLKQKTEEQKTSLEDQLSDLNVFADKEVGLLNTIRDVLKDKQTDIIYQLREQASDISSVEDVLKRNINNVLENTYTDVANIERITGDFASTADNIDRTTSDIQDAVQNVDAGLSNFIGTKNFDDLYNGLIAWYLDWDSDIANITTMSNLLNSFIGSKSFDDLYNAITTMSYKKTSKEETRITRQVLKPYDEGRVYRHSYYGKGYGSYTYSDWHRSGYREYTLTDTITKMVESTLIPQMAEGGVTDKPTTVVFGEAGAEAIIPLHEGKDTLKYMHDDVRAIRELKPLLEDIKEVLIYVMNTTGDQNKKLHKIYRAIDNSIRGEEPFQVQQVS